MSLLSLGGGGGVINRGNFVSVINEAYLQGGSLVENPLQDPVFLGSHT